MKIYRGMLWCEAYFYTCRIAKCTAQGSPKNELMGANLPKQPWEATLCEVQAFTETAILAIGNVFYREKNYALNIPNTYCHLK